MFAYRTRLSALARQSYGIGYHRAHLYSDYRRHGLARTNPWRVFLVVGGLLLRHGPKALFSRSGRFTWTRHASEQLGRLTGSVRYRTLYL